MSQIKLTNEDIKILSGVGGVVVVGGLLLKLFKYLSSKTQPIVKIPGVTEDSDGWKSANDNADNDDNADNTDGDNGVSIDNNNNNNNRLGGKRSRKRKNNKSKKSRSKSKRSKKYKNRSIKSRK